MNYLLIALFAAVLLFGCVSQTILPEPTATPTAAPTVTAQPTAIATPIPTIVFVDATPAPSPTPVSEFTEMTFDEFLADCSKSTKLTGVLRAQQVRLEGKISTIYDIVNRNGVIITLEGFGSASKPTGMEATGSTIYTFFGTPSKHPIAIYTQNECWLKLEKIENTEQVYPLPE
jgi:hypothetical protein